MSFFTPKAPEGKFVLKDIVYDITDASLVASYQDMELVLFSEVPTFQELKGRKFI